MRPPGWKIRPRRERSNLLLNFVPELLISFLIYLPNFVFAIFLLFRLFLELLGLRGFLVKISLG